MESFIQNFVKIKCLTKKILMKNLRLHNVSIHRNFYQNRFINEYARKKKAKISEFFSEI